MDLKQITIDYFLENEADAIKFIKGCPDEVPYLNALKLDNVKNGSLVRFRGMVQDMRNPEIYIEKCEITNEKTKNICFISGKYKDIITCQENETINLYSRNNVQSERQRLVIVTVPGLNDWISEIEARKYNDIHDVEINLSSSTNKRSLDSDDESDKPGQNNQAINAKSESSSSSGENERKRICNAKDEKSVPKLKISKEYLLNLPLPERDGKVCIINLYDTDTDIKLNEVFDFVGFISMDPCLNPIKNQEDQDENDLETLVNHPSPSLVPTIHTVFWERLKHVNPLVTGGIDPDKSTFFNKELKLILTEILFGDELAASYLLYHLMSTIYLHKDLTVLGKFTLNISNVPQPLLKVFGKSLYEFIELLTSHSHYLPMSLENMNCGTFVPKQDLDANRLTSGVLQLSADTHLVLDETALSSGRLNEAGVRAVGALKRLIEQQEIGYDFGFYPLDFKHNIPILIISEGKSMLPSDYHVVLSPSDVHVDTYSEIVSAAKKLLPPELLNNLREYLTVSRHKNPSFPKDVEAFIQEDYTNISQRPGGNFADNLHHLLVLSRLIASGHGKDSIDRASWKTACELESGRCQRL